jgi:hypothetical protein
LGIVDLTSNASAAIRFKATGHRKRRPTLPRRAVSEDAPRRGQSLGDSRCSWCRELPTDRRAAGDWRHRPHVVIGTVSNNKTSTYLARMPVQRREAIPRGSGRVVGACGCFSSFDLLDCR